MLPIITHITAAHQEAKRIGCLALNDSELAFIESIYAQGQRSGFTGLSAKQAAWFNAIAMKLDACRVKTGFEIMAARCRSRQAWRERCYITACMGY